MERIFLDKKHMLALLSERLEGVSPVRKLSQGYSYVENKEGRAVTDACKVAAGDELSIRLLKGRLKARVTEVIR